MRRGCGNCSLGRSRDDRRGYQQANRGQGGLRQRMPVKNALAMTTAEADMLRAAIVAALGVSSKARTIDEALFFELLVLRDQPASARVELQELLRAVRSIPALEVFDNARQCALGHEEPVDPRFLVGG